MSSRAWETVSAVGTFSMRCEEAKQSRSWRENGAWGGFFGMGEITVTLQGLPLVSAPDLVEGLRPARDWDPNPGLCSSALFCPRYLAGFL